MKTTKLMDRLFSGQEPDFSQKVQEGIEEARTNGTASMPDEHLEFSSDDEGKVEIKDEANGEVTVATTNPDDPNDEKLEVKVESDEAAKQAEEDAKKAAEAAKKEAKKAELEQQIAGNLDELKKAVSDMTETKDKTLAAEVKDKVKEMSEELTKIEEEGIDKEKVESELKSFSDKADEILAEPEAEPAKEPEVKESVEVKAECGDKKFSITFSGVTGDYVASFMKAFSDKMEEIAEEEKAAEEAEKQESETEDKPEEVIANNIQEIGKAVEDLKKEGDKDLAAKVEEKINEVKEQIEEVKKEGVDTEKMESDLKTFSDAVEEVKAEEAKKAAEEAKKEDEEKKEGDDKQFSSSLGSYLDMEPKSAIRSDKTFSAKEVEENKNTLGGCLFHRF